jgi:hypothetical protein
MPDDKFKSQTLSDKKFEIEDILSTSFRYVGYECVNGNRVIACFGSEEEYC